MGFKAIVNLIWAPGLGFFWYQQKSGFYNTHSGMENITAASETPSQAAVVFGPG